MRLEGSATGRRNAKRLRREMTPPEVALWLTLRKNEAGLRFRKQHPVRRPGDEQDYVLDVYCASARLAMEVDGEAHDRGHQPQRDVAKDAWLASQGVRVIRYGARRVLSNLDGVVTQIIDIVTERRPIPRS